MGLLGQIFGLGAKEAGEGIGEVMRGAGTLAKDIRSAITGELSPEAKAELEKKILELEAMLADGQTKINLAEAQSGSLFVAGWRPAIGWVCAISLATYYIPRFALGTGLWFAQSYRAGVLAPMPEMGVGDILALVASLLGMSWLRSQEKKSGVAR